jgi:hypothetical protein
MPLIPFDGQLDDDMPQGNLIPFDGELDEEPKKKKAGFGTSLKQALASAGSAMDQAISLPAGALASVFNQETGDQLFKSMDEREAARKKWANPENLETDSTNDLLAIGVTLPAQVPAMLGQAATKGIDLVRRGENVRKAQAATLVDTALNAAGMGPMAAAKTFAGRAAIGAGANVAFGAGSDAATQLLSENEETKKAYDPYDPKRRLQEALVGGVTQGVMGERPKQAKPTTNAARALADLKAKKAPEAVAPRAEPGSNAWQDAQLKLRAEMDAREMVGPVNETAQLDLIDQPLQGRMVSPYEAVPGDWRVDENGMPIKADLSMELQNLQEPLQRNLWGDELDVQYPRDPNKPLTMNGDIEGVERFSEPMNFRNDPENQIPLTEAIDSMDPAARTAALEQTQMGRELPASPEMEVAKMDAERLPLGSKARRDAFIAAKRKTQGGVIAPDVFLKDFPDFVFSKLKDASGQLKTLFRGVQSDYDGPERPMLGTVGEGIYLTESKTLANNYATGKESGRHVKAAYVNMRNPFEIEMGSPEHRGLLLGDKTSRKAFSDQVKQAGYDGVIIRNGEELKEVMAFSPEQVQNAFSTPQSVARSKKQSGGVLFDWKKKNEVDQLAKVAGIKDKLAAFVPTEMDAEGTIELARKGKDVDQNIAQKVVNQFTKGGLYQAEKTGNPIVKFTVDKVLNADRKARADVRDFIHDSLAPAMRNLSTQEMIDVAAILNQADMDQIPVDSNFLRQYGFSDKQIAFAEAHRATMDKAFESLNQARAAVGKAPVEKRVSYAAMAATGDFRKLVHKIGEDGVKEVVGVISANTRRGLAKIEKGLSGKDYIFGEERYAGGTKKGASDVQAIMDILEHLSENNEATRDFLDVLSDLKAQDAYNFVNMSKHTKQKKGVFGMEGRKEWESELQNAKDFMDAQLKYAESAIRWGHLSDAATEVKKVLASDVDQPNAKKWAEGYFNNALGLNPSETGRSFEKAMDSFWKETGVGKTIPTNIQQYSRKIVNTLLLGLNPAFLATNVVQPLMAMPAMNAFLKGRGLDENSLITMGYDSMAEGWFTMAKERLGNMSQLEKEATKYAKENHVFGTDLVDTSSVSRRNAEYYLDKTGNFLASNVESGTRKMMYYGFVHMLDKNGLGKDFGLAQNLTDIAMNNYSPVERPNVFNMLGPVGDMAANLSSFKHNELSRLAMFAREIGKEKTAIPLLIQLSTGVAAAGITGAIGFAEADWLYRQITKALGKPDSLTNVVFKFSESMAGSTKNPYALSHGVFSYLGLDLSKRLGVSDVVPNSVGEALFPGGSKLVDVAGAGLSAIGDPSQLNMQRLAREVAPGAVTGPMDREWFSKDTPQGELAVNRRTLEGQVIRNEADKMAKNFGFMGVNESVQKQKLWDLKQQGIGYSELRTAVVKKMAEQMFTSGKFNPALIDNYIKYEGDLTTLETELTNRVEKQGMSAVDALKIKALAAKKIPQLKQGQRVMESFQ